MSELILGAIQAVKQQPVVAQPRTLQEQSRINLSKSEHVREVTEAWDRLQELRKRLGEDAPSLKNLDLEKLNSSQALRKLITDYNSIHFINAPQPKGSFKREYSSEREEKISADQSMLQSSVMKQSKAAYETTLHNHQQVEAAREPEEGVESCDFPDGYYDPMKLNVKKLEREIKNELKLLAIERPHLAA